VLSLGGPVGANEPAGFFQAGPDLPLGRVVGGRSRCLTFVAKRQTAPGEDVAKLPADERATFTQLWADVAALLKKAEENSK